ncbi:hypothetical protein ACFOPN_00335 [Xanthomonas hyacinthi]|uniref:hypothetical protein n=1 Tax=Xanthomonas hyacinthi TaxID=56455 RepID=UPI0036138186
MAAKHYGSDDVVLEEWHCSTVNLFRESEVVDIKFLRFSSLLLQGCLFLILVSVNACSAERNDESSIDVCKRRLAERSKVDERKISDFCACFVTKAELRFDYFRLEEEFESGSSEEFKRNLRTEFSECKEEAKIPLRRN